MLLAADPASSGGPGIFSFLSIILLFGALWFLMIRPMNKRKREAASMQSQIAVGDEVQTVGGLFATIVSINDDESVTLEASPGVEHAVRARRDRARGHQGRDRR